MIPKYSTYSFCCKGILAGENSTLKDVVSFSPLKVALKGRNSDGLKELRLFPRAPPVYHLKDASPGFFQERPPMVADRLKGGFLPQRYAMYVIMSLCQVCGAIHLLLKVPNFMIVFLTFSCAFH